jgi:hypothetical protein
MARIESDREDLLREATALVERVELSWVDDEGSTSTLVAGFRKDGALSLFFGADPVYQFNAAGELRRAFRDGLLYKAVGGRLVSLDRVRTEVEVQLLRRELTADQERAFIQIMRSKLEALAILLERDNYTIVGQVPSTAEVTSKLREWLGEHDDVTIADSPRV